MRTTITAATVAALAATTLIGGAASARTTDADDLDAALTAGAGAGGEKSYILEGQGGVSRHKKKIGALDAVHNGYSVGILIVHKGKTVAKKVDSDKSAATDLKPVYRYYDFQKGTKYKLYGCLIQKGVPKHCAPPVTIWG